MSWSDVARAAQVEYLRLLAANPAAETRRIGDGFAVATGIRSNTENGVVARAATDADLRDAIAWFEERDAPAMWLNAEPALRERLVVAGCRRDRGGVDMGADLAALELPTPRPPIGVDLVAARTHEELEDVLALMLAHHLFVDDADLGRAQTVFLALGLAADASLQHYLAREGGETIGMATAFFHDEAVLLQHVVVVEHRRRRGVGRALALARLQEAAARGCRFAVLGPTPESRALYEPLGFTVTPSRGASVLYLPLAPPG